MSELTELEARLRRLNYPLLTVKYRDDERRFIEPSCSVIVHHSKVGASSANGETLSIALAAALDRFEASRP